MQESADGGASLIVKGYIYIPNQQLTYNGGANSDGCTFIIARTIKFSGNTTTYIRNTPTECADVGIDVAMEQTQVVLLQ